MEEIRDPFPPPSWLPKNFSNFFHRYSFFGEMRLGWEINGCCAIIDYNLIFCSSYIYKYFMNFIQHPVWISDQGNRRFEDCIIIQQSSYDVISYFRIYFQCELTLIPPAPSLSRAVTPSHKEIKRSRGHPGASGFGATSPIIAIPPARIIDPPVGYLFFLSFLPSSLFLAKRTHFARKCNGFRFCREVYTRFSFPRYR